MACRAGVGGGEGREEEEGSGIQPVASVFFFLA